MTIFSGPTGPKILLTQNQVIMPYRVPQNRPYDTPLRRTRQSLPSCIDRFPKGIDHGRWHLRSK